MWLWKWFFGYLFVLAFWLELKFWPEHKSTNPGQARPEVPLKIDVIPSPDSPTPDELHGCSDSERLPWWVRFMAWTIAFLEDMLADPPRRVIEITMADGSIRAFEVIRTVGNHYHVAQDSVIPGVVDVFVIRKTDTRIHKQPYLQERKKS